LLPTDHLHPLCPRRDAADLFVVAVLGVWRWWSVGDVGELRFTNPMLHAFGLLEDYKCLLSMIILRFQCPFAGLSGCQDGHGNGLTKTSLITHLRDRHCNGEAQAITRHSLTTDLVVFEKVKVTLKRLGIFLCGVCFKTHTFRAKCHHSKDSDFVLPPDSGDDLLHDQHGGFTLPLLDSLFSKGLRTVKSIHPKSNLNCKSAIKCQRHEEGIVNAIRSWGYAVRVRSSCGVAPYSDATLEELKTKHPFLPAPSLPHIPIDQHHLIASLTLVLDKIKSFPYGTSCGRDMLRAQGLLKCVVVSNELTSSITQVPGSGICPIALGTVWRRLGSKVSAIMIGHFLDGYLDGLPFSVGLSRGSEAIPHAVNCLMRVVETMLAGVFPPNIARPLNGVKLLGGPANVDFDFCNERAMKRVAKAIVLMDAVAKNDPQWYDNWQWMLANVPFAFGGLGVYYAGDVLNYAFLASRLQSAGLQTKLFWHTDDLVEIEDHNFGWLRTVPIFGLGQTMNGKTYRILCYRLDHVVSCTGIIGIKPRHNVVRDTLVDICYRSGIQLGCMAVVRPPNPNMRTFNDKGIDFILGGYTEHSKTFKFYVIEPNGFISINSIIKSMDAIFDENRFSSIPRPSHMIPIDFHVWTIVVNRSVPMVSLLCCGVDLLCMICKIDEDRGNIVTNSRVTPSWREIVSVTVLVKLASYT
nr:zinc finger, CCHC-type [Tanacetum cinerariifolium]